MNDSRFIHVSYVLHLQHIVKGENGDTETMPVFREGIMEPGRPYRNTRVMDKRGGESSREAPRPRLFITLPIRRRFELQSNGGGNGIEVETRVDPATNRTPFHAMDRTSISSRDDAPAAETNTPEDGRIQASTIRPSQVAGSRVPVAKPYGRKTR